MSPVLIFAVIIIVIAIYIWSVYNGVVTARVRIREAWSGIEVQLKRRSSLIPNLIETVKGYAKHEKGIIKEVTDARKAMLSAGDLKGRMKAGNELQTALKSIFALAENYPQLKANENFLQLQQELSAIEDKIAYSRQFYNDSILSYNNSVERIPGVIFASMFGKKEKEYVKLPEEQKSVPKVSF